MKKLLLTAFLAFTGFQLLAQQWQPTNLTNVTYLPIQSVEIQNNDLFAILNNGVTTMLYKLDSSTTSWTQLNPPGITGSPIVLQAVGGRLYMSTVVSGVGSLIYYSTDNGSTFTIDTAGMADYVIAKWLITKLVGYQSTIVAATAGGYYVKDTTQTQWHKVDVTTALSGADFMIAANDSLYAYDNTGANAFYASPIDGNSFVLRSGNLPSDFAANYLTADQSSGRLYIAGVWNSQTNYGIYYSDNGGASWTLLTNASSFIGTNYNNTQQLVTAIYANGNTFYLGLQNDKNLSAPNVIGTTTGVANLAYDTLGFPNVAGGVYPTKFLTYKGQLYTALLYVDVYRKGAPAGLQDADALPLVTLYPNPSTGRLYFINIVNGTAAAIMNEEGKLIRSFTVSSGEIDIADLPHGVYFIRFISKDKKASVQRFIKD